MRDLFTPITRDERQEESVKKWILSRGHGTVVGCTGYGRFSVATRYIKSI